jgi:hypothetical protein
MQITNTTLSKRKTLPGLSMAGVMSDGFAILPRPNLPWLQGAAQQVMQQVTCARG